MVRAALLSGILICSTRAAAQGPEPTSDSLNRRIAFLERRVADLEQRVRELDSLIKSPSPRARTVAASGNWHELMNWRRLGRGMTMDQVRALLGEPESVKANPIFTTWAWGSFPNDAEVEFDQGGKVTGWSEPRP